MIIFRVAETKHDHGWCVAIRTLVFEVEQHVDISLEVDQHEDACRHILGIDDRIQTLPMFLVRSSLGYLSISTHRQLSASF